MGSGLGPKVKERMEEILKELEEGPQTFREMFGREQNGTDSRAIAFLKEQGRIASTPNGYVRTDVGGYCPACGWSVEEEQRRCNNPNCFQPVRGELCSECGKFYPIPPVPPNSGRTECPRCGCRNRTTLPEYDLLRVQTDCKMRECDGKLEKTASGFACQSCGRHRKPFRRLQEVFSHCPECDHPLRLRHNEMACPECGEQFNFQGFTLEIDWDEGEREYHIDGRMVTSAYHSSVEDRIWETLEKLNIEEYAELNLRTHPASEIKPSFEHTRFGPRTNRPT